jgi:transmembrane sensor
VKEAGTQTVPAARAKDIKAQAAAWLERKDRPEWSRADQAELDAWLANSNVNLIAYRRISDVWARTERLVVLRQPEAGRSVIGAQSKIPPMLIKTVASAIVLAIIGVAATLFLSIPKAQTYVTAVGGHDTFVLPDGSRIELNTDTAVRVSDTTHQRTVWLDRGEAYFQVSHDAARPFVVFAGDRRITDLGTKFLMRRDQDQLHVTVVEGRVKFEANSVAMSSPPAVLAAGDAVTATATSVVLTKKPARDLASDLGWLRGVFVFRHTTLADAANEYNRYNQEKIVIVGPGVARLTLSGTLPTNNIEAFIEVARNFFALNVEHRGDEFVISR